MNYKHLKLVDSVYYHAFADDPYYDAVLYGYVQNKNNMTTASYWDSFYSNDYNEIKEPSNFSVFVNNYFKKLCGNNKLTLVDLGCGNGRDLMYFIKMGFNAIGLEYSNIAVQKLKEKKITMLSG